jgi:hypothetical protein
MDYSKNERMGNCAKSIVRTILETYSKDKIENMSYDYLIYALGILGIVVTQFAMQLMSKDILEQGKSQMVFTHMDSWYGHIKMLMREHCERVQKGEDSNSVGT